MQSPGWARRERDLHDATLVVALAFHFYCILKFPNLAWADVRLLFGIPLIAAALWWLRRQRERRGWLAEPEVDIDLL